MKYEINFTIDDIEDSFIIEADTIEEVIELAKKETDKRGVTEEKNNLWSREIK